MHLFDTHIGTAQLVLLIVALLIACAFEFVNGFHDTANAVATVIYTRSLHPWKAVILSGTLNLLGVYLGGIAVAMSIIKLLPVELLAASGSGAGLAMVLALLVAAIMWNLGTWWLGPAPMERRTRGLFDTSKGLHRTGDGGVGIMDGVVASLFLA
jgi:PiT family inorganic phosphate transporter